MQWKLHLADPRKIAIKKKTHIQQIENLIQIIIRDDDLVHTQLTLVTLVRDHTLAH